MGQIRQPRQTTQHDQLKNYATGFVGMMIGLPIIWLSRVANRIFNFDRRGAASNLNRLTQEVRTKYDFLFSEYGGRVVPEQSSGSPHMDFAALVIEVNDLYIRATRDRGDIDWEVSLSDRPWTPLKSILKKIARPGGLPQSEYEGLRFHLPEIERLMRSEN